MDFFIIIYFYTNRKMSSRKQTYPSIKKTITKRTINERTIPLIKTKMDIDRIDEIYSKLKKNIAKYKGQPKEDLLTIAQEISEEIFHNYIRGTNENLMVLEFLLAILKYLSRVRKPYNKKRIELVAQILFTNEENSLTFIFKNAKYRTIRTFISVDDINYFILAKKYLKKINEKFNVDTRLFTDNDGEYKDDPYLLRPENKYNINFISNTHLRKFIIEILKNNSLQSKSISNSNSIIKSRSHSY